MRFVVIGAGAIGGVVGGRLAEQGMEVVMVARGAHHDRIYEDGLLVRSPDREVRVPIPVTERVADAGIGGDDVVLLAVKGHDTAEALLDVPPGVAIACLQNGVDNERVALRRTHRVYAVPVMCPASYSRPGIVEAWSSPITGVLDVGCYPTGVDRTAERIAEAFSAATFSSEARPDVMRFKWTKLLMNLANVIEAAAGGDPETPKLYARAREEGIAVLEAAGIEYASEEEDLERRRGLVGMHPIDGQRREGGSTWQSLERGTGTSEADQLNGEIVFLGRLYGVATPVNEMLQRVGNELARSYASPGSMTVAQMEAQLV